MILLNWAASSCWPRLFSRARKPASWNGSIKRHENCRCSPNGFSSMRRQDAPCVERGSNPWEIPCSTQPYEKAALWLLPRLYPRGLQMAQQRG